MIERIGLCGAAVACLLSLADAAAAQETLRLPAFGEVVDVRVINLEVVVTHRGERVEDLRADDFSLQVDGQDVPIEFFTEVTGGRARSTSAGQGLPVPSLEPGADVPTRYLVFIDDDFAIPSARNRVLTELADQLSELGETDRMAIVAYDGQRLDLLSSWTRSLARLRTALNGAQDRRAYGMLRRSELRSAARGRYYSSRSSPQSSFSGTGFLGLGRARDDTRDPAVLRYSDSHGEISQVVRAATSALRGFAGVPGRKVMLLLAGGWPAYARWGDRDIFDRQDRERAIFAPLVATANRLGYTLYPVDVQGGSYDTRGVGAEFGTLRSRRIGALAEQERERLSEDALHYLADETGGRAILGSGKLKALEQATGDTRSYYWLGFTPVWQGDGKDHRIEVKVRRGSRTESAKVRTRRGFSDLSRQNQVSMWIESAHLFDTPLPGSSDLTVELGESQPAGSGKLLLPLTLKLPLDQITVLPVGGAQKATDAAPQATFATRLELRVAATDADGANAGVPVTAVEIAMEGPPKPGQIGVYETRLKIRRKRHRLLISLYDPLTSTLFARRLDFEP